MRRNELRDRLHVSKHNNAWHRKLLRYNCLQTTRGVGGDWLTIDWNDRDANWLIRLYEQNPKKTGYYVTHLVTNHYHYKHLPVWCIRYLEKYVNHEGNTDDQWRDMIQETVLRLRTYQIILTTLSQDAAKAGYPPLDSWTDTSLYDAQEREQIITETRRREPEA